MADGKSTFSVEIELETIKSFMDMIEKYKTIMDETNKVWKETLETVKQLQSNVKNLDEPARKTRRTTRSKDDLYAEANAVFGVASPERRPLGLKPAGWRSPTNQGPESRMGLRPGSIEIKPAGPRPRNPSEGWGPRGGPAVDIPNIKTGEKPSRGPLGLKPGDWKPPPTGQSVGRMGLRPGEDTWFDKLKGLFSNKDDSSAAKLNTQFQRESLKSFPEQLKYFKDFRALSSVFTLGGTGLGGLGILGRLLGIGPAGLAVSAAAGAVGGLAERASNFRDQQAQAQAYNLEPYQKRAFANIMTKYLGAGGDEALFGGLVQATTTPAGGQRLRNVEGIYGVQTTGNETRQEQADAALRAMRKMATEVPESRWEPLIKGYGVEGVFNRNVMERFKQRGTTEEELNVDIARADKLAALGPSKEDAKVLEDAAANWQESVLKFSSALDQLTAKILGFVINPLGAPTQEDANKSPTPGHAVPIPWGEWLKNLNPFSPAHAGELDFNEKLNKGGDKSTFGDIPIPESLTGAANMPSQFATPESLEEVGTKGEFVIPGQEKIPQNIQDIRDAIVSIDDKKVLGTLTDSGINVGGVGGATQQYRTGFGPEGTSVPTYSSGGMGEAGETRAPSRMTGEGTSGAGSGIRSSGLGGGKRSGGATGGGGGGTSSDDLGKAYGKAKPGSAAAMIFKGESKGDYDIYNYSGGRGVGHKDFENMTVGQVMEEQKEGKIFAAGAYQVIPKTMEGAVKSLNIDPNTKFDKETQDKIFSGYLATSKKGRGPLEDYIKGKSDDADAALKSAAQEWASIQYHGHGMYGGINSASTTDAQMLAGMKNARDIYAKTHNYQGALFGEDTPVVKSDKDAIARASAPTSKAAGAAYPPPNTPGASNSGYKGHLNDMDNFQSMSKGQDINVYNKSGANVVMQSAQLGLASGSFNT